jgi:hypothetical protein
MSLKYRSYQPIRRDVDEIRSRVEVGTLCRVKSLSAD